MPTETKITLALCLIVSDEEATLARCLDYQCDATIFRTHSSGDRMRAIDLLMTCLQLGDSPRQYIGISGTVGWRAEQMLTELSRSS